MRSNTAASGIIEDYGEREVLLDDLIHEIDERNETECALNDEKSAQEKRLLAAGETIRENALCREAGISCNVNPVPASASAANGGGGGSNDPAMRDSSDDVIVLDNGSASAPEIISHHPPDPNGEGAAAATDTARQDSARTSRR